MRFGLFFFFSLLPFFSLSQERIGFVNLDSVFLECNYYKSRINYIANLATKTDQYIDSINEHFNTHLIHEGCFDRIDEIDLMQLKYSRQQEINLADSLVNRALFFHQQEAIEIENQLNTKLTMDLQQFSKLHAYDRIITTFPAPTEAVDTTIEFITYCNQKND